MVDYEKFKILNSRMRLLLLVSALGVGCSSFQGSDQDSKQSAKPRLSAARIAEGDGLHLSQALQKNIRHDPINPIRQKLLKDIAFAKNNHKKMKNTLTYEACLQKYSQAEECRFLRKEWAQEWVDEWTLQESDSDVPLEKVSKRKRQKTIATLVKNFKAGRLEIPVDERPGDVYMALKKFSSWTPALADLSQKLLAEPKCQPAEIYNFLGLKAEEYFPNVELLKLAQQIYLKADGCAKDAKDTASKYVQSARFRLGLLSVLDHNCKQAHEVFTKLEKQTAGDFTTRALYWNAHCDKSEAKQEEFLTHYDELFRTNPLGFHTLSMNQGASVLVENLGKPIDPIIQTRTDSQPQFNIWLSIIEDLDFMGEQEAVRHLFSPIRHSSEFLNNFEPGVRLYLSTFAYRANDRLCLFRILDSVFRTQSEYVVDSTMKLFYPMEYFDKILANSNTVNPYLIAALIRQESAFQADVKSHVGAVGLMQLMPGTARLVERKVNRKKLLDPETNVRIGIKYFEALVNRFHGDVELALAAYNAGPEAVDQWMKRYPLKNKLLFLDLIPYSETRNYVTLIGRNYYWYTQLYADLLKPGLDVVQKRQPAVFNALRPSEE